MIKIKSHTWVKIDHDFIFEEYNPEYILSWSKKIPYPVKEIKIRRSCGGNTHVCVKIGMKISKIDELLIRAIMRDDPRRLRGDLERYALNSEIFGLLFDHKINVDTGEVFKAGNWIKIKG